MKNSWIWVILLPAITLLIPEFIQIKDAVLLGLTSVAGYVGVITIVTQGLKPLIQRYWKAWYEHKYFGETLSLVAAAGLGFGGYLFSYGIFEYATWYYTLGIVLLGWMTSNRWYDVTLKE